MAYRNTIKKILLLEKLGYLFLIISIFLYKVFPICIYGIVFAVLFLVGIFVFDNCYPRKQFYNKKDILESSINYGRNQTNLSLVIVLITIIPINYYKFEPTNYWYPIVFVFIVFLLFGLLLTFLLRKFSNSIAKKETVHFVYRQKFKRLIKRTFIVVIFIGISMLLRYFKWRLL